MKNRNQQPKQPQESISGSIERVTYYNSDNGFCVLRVKVQGYRDLVTITGVVASISVGEYIQCSGIWHNDYNYGRQFKADFLKAVKPNTLSGIEKYLGSGLIKGIGEHFAKKLVKSFGEEVFDVIEHKPELLSKIEGIGKKRAKSICSNWQDQKVIREIMVFLQSHGIGTTRATRIFKTYGNNAIRIVSENPYKLAQDIRGIGFVSADAIANNLGIEKNSLIRARAGISHLLLEASSRGHCGLPKDLLMSDADDLLEIDSSILDLALDEEIESTALIEDQIDGVDSIFLARFYFYEKNIAKMLLGLARFGISWDIENIEQDLSEIENSFNIQLSTTQRRSIIEALKNKVMVITGGPGTGKTTLIRSLLQVISSKKLKIKLCAPTGRAAKRLSETSGMEATTIHRLLGVNTDHGGFAHNEEFPLDCDYLIIDEMSMVDVALFHALLKSLPRKAAVLIVGDVDQLPSVGAGQVLKDIIDSGVIATTKLTEIFRQSKTSNIIVNAHKINNGILPDLQPSKNDSDFYFVEAEQGEDIINKIITVVKDRIPKKFNFHPVDDIQILCPMQRSGSGARSLNIELQKALNPNHQSGINRYGQIFAVGDKVMQMENNYNKEVYNGDIGNIVAIDQQDEEIQICFYGRNVIYEYADLDQINLAYATTIHKSQGSEYPVVVIVVTMQSYIMLKRNLIYTAITRGKELVVVVGQKKAISLATKNSNHLTRHSKLREWLCII